MADNTILIPAAGTTSVPALRHAPFPRGKVPEGHAFEGHEGTVPAPPSATKVMLLSERWTSPRRNSRRTVYHMLRN